MHNSWHQLTLSLYRLPQRSEGTNLVVNERQDLHVGDCKGGPRVKKSLQACSP